MVYETSLLALAIFFLFVGSVLAFSFYLGRQARSAQGYFAAHGQIHWFVNGIAFAGDYLSAASFLGICGMIAFFGYDGFLYSIGYLAGWIVALFVIAEPIKRLGKFTFADALDSRFHSSGIQLSAALGTLVISLFYLIPQMVGAGALVQPLLGLPHYAGVLLVGAAVILIVVTAGMVSTTWVQFIKGSLLVAFCLVLTILILNRGLSLPPQNQGTGFGEPVPAETVFADHELAPASHAWEDSGFLKLRDKKSQALSVWRVDGDTLWQTQTVVIQPDGAKEVNGRKEGESNYQGLQPVGSIFALPSGQASTGPLAPIQFLSLLDQSSIVVWPNKVIREESGATWTIYYPQVRKGSELLTAGGSPTFAGVRGTDFWKKLDFVSLMLALFCGTASLPHILIRYYTVKDQSAARRSTVVGIAAIGFFYVLTLYLGLGAMVSGALDPTNSNMAAPLLAKSFGPWLFACISAIAFTTVLGTVSGLIMAASGAVAHDLIERFAGWNLNEWDKVRAGKWAAVVVGVIAMACGILFKKMNVTFLVGWAFNIAASANLPSLLMLLFWKRTSRHGITAAILVGMSSSLAWVLCSEPALKDLYGLDTKLHPPLVPFSQPALVTIPLGFLVLIVVSLLFPEKSEVATTKQA